MAVSPDLPDDGRTTDGRPRVVRNVKKPGKKEKMDLDDLKKEVEIDDHRIPLQTLCSQLNTDSELVSLVFFSCFGGFGLRFGEGLALWLKDVFCCPG